VVAAIVPAFERADSVGATARALLRLGRAGGGRDDVWVDRVLVVDDGSGDATSAEARAAGAEVLCLPDNRGKGAAVAAGIAACDDADVFLLIDADLGNSAASADRLLAPVLADEADLVVGALPAAGRKGGFGGVKRLAASGIRRACGLTAHAPLSGQRAVRAAYVRDLHSAERFGLEVAMTIDAVRAGARTLEVPVPMDHRHTGRTLRGFLHRGRQGVDILAALWSRLTSRRARAVGTVATTLAVLVGLVAAGAGQVSASMAGGGDADQVVIVGVPHLGLDDLESGRMPILDRLRDRGAAAATNVRTLSTRPTTAEAYATLGAGVPVRAGVGVDQALPADAAFEGGTAADVLARRSGVRPTGELVVPATPEVVAGAGRHVTSSPGTLGQALGDAGVTTAVVTNADTVAPDGTPEAHRPAALAVVDHDGSVATGTVAGDAFLVPDVDEPYGVRSDAYGLVDATTAALDRADLVLVDPGDTDRAWAYAARSTPEAAEQARRRALGRVDRYLAHLVPTLEPDTLLLVVGMTPPTREWELTPTVAYGSGVVPGSLHSTGTRRDGLITLTDLAPTVLDWFDVPTPDGMIGRSLRFRSDGLDAGSMQRLNDLARSREDVYYPMALTFIVVQALVYLVAALAFSQRATRGRRVGRFLRLAVLTCAAWPLATFLERGVPGIEHLGGPRHLLVWVLAGAAAVLASQARRHPLSPLAWVAGATLAVLLTDVARGADLQMASVLGYSPHTASRYTGYGNTAFAVLAACAVVLAAAHVARAPRRSEAVLTAGALLTIVLVADAWPTLGADAGGVLTLVPVFGLLVLALAGRRLSWREVALLGGATVGVLALVAGVDILRGSGQGHLARFVSGALDGDGTMMTTVERKWATNMRVFGQSVWTWMVPITAAFMLYVLVVARGWQRLLPAGSVVRTGVVATLAAGVVGWLVNDSGVVVTALVFVFVGPYLTLLALHKESGAPTLLEPAPAGRDPAPTVPPGPEHALP
jgi:hypothetical protein